MQERKIEKKENEGGEERGLDVLRKRNEAFPPSSFTSIPSSLAALPNLSSGVEGKAEISPRR